MLKHRPLSYTALFTALFFYACKEADKTAEKATDKTAEKTIAQQKIGSAISCTINGLTVEDSTLYMNAGGKEFIETRINDIQPSAGTPEGMVLIPGGEFSMGSVNPVGLHAGGNQTMNDARPVHRVYVDGFYMDATEVTNAQYAAFVKATGYITIAERKPTKEEFPGVSEEDLITGSVVFSPPDHKVALDNYLQWWSYIAGANWKHPLGPASSIAGKENYPVVQIAWDDAVAYAKWAGKRLPTEAEWEFAARAGKTGDLYTWGNQLKPDDKQMANIFEGEFPNNDAGEDGFKGIAPVKQFEPNAYGLYDIAGNVWEWCSDWYRADYYTKISKAGVAKNPKGPSDSEDPDEPGVKKKLQRGGSFLCTDQYCTRYMVGTRGKGEINSGANHIGFRCVRDLKPVANAVAKN
ncbi:MAG TPA: formylglycine-generating enzyme family protein [Panacibacter sp.]|nr:formylglycine-generating enzyme family protein [Panacibacter sp.]